MQKNFRFELCISQQFCKVVMKHVGTHWNVTECDFSFQNETYGISFYLVHILKQVYKSLLSVQIIIQV